MGVSIREDNGRHWRRDDLRAAWKLQCRRCAHWYLPRCFEHLGINTFGEACSRCRGVRSTRPRNLFGPAKEKRRSLDDIVQQAIKDEQMHQDATYCPPGKVVCRTCRRQKAKKLFRKHGVDEMYRDCASCRSHVTRHYIDIPESELCILDRAYRKLYPDLVDHGPHVTGFEVLNNPLLYPGKSYWHLTREECNAAVRLAKEMLREQGTQIDD